MVFGLGQYCRPVYVFFFGLGVLYVSVDNGDSGSSEEDSDPNMSVKSSDEEGENTWGEGESLESNRSETGNGDIGDDTGEDTGDNTGDKGLYRGMLTKSGSEKKCSSGVVSGVKVVRFIVMLVVWSW